MGVAGCLLTRFGNNAGSTWGGGTFAGGSEASFVFVTVKAFVILFNGFVVIAFFEAFFAGPVETGFEFFKLDPVPVIGLNFNFGIFVVAIKFGGAGL